LEGNEKYEEPPKPNERTKRGTYLFTSPTTAREQEQPEKEFLKKRFVENSQ